MTRLPASTLARHVILVGLPGAGKSTVAPLLAIRWSAEWIDFDEEIERRTGRSVSELFAKDGEPAFRALESALTLELLDRPPMVWATGGGWITAPDVWRRTRDKAHIVHLRVSVAEATRRLRRTGAVGETRPLLRGADLEARLGELWAQRSTLYDQAHQTIDVEHVDIQELTELLVASVARTVDSRVG